MYEALCLDERAMIINEFADGISSIKNRVATVFFAARIYKFHLRGLHMNKTGWVCEIVEHNHARKTTANKLVDDFIERGLLWPDTDRLRPTDGFLREFLYFGERLDALLLQHGVAIEPPTPVAHLCFDRDGISGPFVGGDRLGIEKKRWVMDMIHRVDIARRHGWDSIQEEIRGTYDKPPELPIRATMLFNGKGRRIVPTRVDVTVDRIERTKHMEIFTLF